MDTSHPSTCKGPCKPILNVSITQNKKDSGSLMIDTAGFKEQVAGQKLGMTRCQEYTLQQNPWSSTIPIPLSYSDCSFISLEFPLDRKSKDSNILSRTFGSSCLLHDCRPSIEVWRDIADQGEELLSHGAHEGRIELHGLYPKGYLLLQRQELGAWMPEFP